MNCKYMTYRELCEMRSDKQDQSLVNLVRLGIPVGMWYVVSMKATELGQRKVQQILGWKKYCVCVCWGRMQGAVV
jgi:hypothetical protein